MTITLVTESNETPESLLECFVGL